MAAQNKIEKFKLGSRIQTLCTEGLIDEEIAGILNEEAEGQYTVSRPTVSRWLRKERKRRKTIADVVLDDYIQTSLPNDLKILEEMMQTYFAIFRGKLIIISGQVLPADQDQMKLEDQDKIQRLGFSLKERVLVGKELHDIIKTKLKFVGLGDSHDDSEPKTEADKKETKLLQDIAREFVKQKVESGNA